MTIWLMVTRFFLRLVLFFFFQDETVICCLGVETIDTYVKAKITSQGKWGITFFNPHSQKESKFAYLIINNNRSMCQIDDFIRTLKKFNSFINFTMKSIFTNNNTVSFLWMNEFKIFDHSTGTIFIFLFKKDISF